jgi:hypothetical protein
MSVLSQFIGGSPTTSIVNYFSSGGVRAGVALTASAYNNAKEALSGALTAGNLATVLTVTGGGNVSYLACYPKDTTSRSVRMEVTVDGVVAFDATSDVAAATAGHGILAAGFLFGSTGGPGYPILFNSSLVVKVATSVASETDKVAIAYTLNKR